MKLKPPQETRLAFALRHLRESSGIGFGEVGAAGVLKTVTAGKWQLGTTDSFGGTSASQKVESKIVSRVFKTPDATAAPKPGFKGFHRVPAPERL